MDALIFGVIQPIQTRLGASLTAFWMLSIPYELQIGDMQLRFTEPSLQRDFSTHPLDLQQVVRRLAKLDPENGRMSATDYFF